MAQQPPICQGFLTIETSRTHAVRHPTLGRNSLDEGSARRIDHYLTTHNTLKGQKSMPPGGIQTHNPTASKVSQTHALYHAAAGIGMQSFTNCVTLVTNKYTQLWWNKTNKKTLLRGEKMNQCHSVHHKSHMYWPETDPRP